MQTGWPLSSEQLDAACRKQQHRPLQRRRFGDPGNASGPSSERIKKRIIKLFQHHGLKITAETNLVQTDFLDITLGPDCRCFHAAWAVSKSVH